jgi:hypothetical protein
MTGKTDSLLARDAKPIVRSLARLMANPETC